MADSDIGWIFRDVFRRLALLLGNTKNQKQREQIQVIIEGIGAIKTSHYKQVKQLQDEKNEGQPRKLSTDLRGGGR